MCFTSARARITLFPARMNGPTRRSNYTLHGSLNARLVVKEEKDGSRGVDETSPIDER